VSCAEVTALDDLRARFAGCQAAPAHAIVTGSRARRGLRAAAGPGRATRRCARVRGGRREISVHITAVARTDRGCSCATIPVDVNAGLVFHEAVPRSAGLLRNVIVLALLLVNCHKETTVAPVEEGCWGATCVEQAEAAMYYGDHAAAREPLAAVCEGGDGFACHRLAELHQHGRGGAVDLAKAATLYEQACEKEHAEGCERRADLARDGQGGPTVELDFALKACEQQRPLACLRVGEQLATARGVEADIPRATEHYEKACKLGDVDGCVAAGNLLSNPEGPAEAKVRALSAFVAACVGHNGYGCLRAAIAFHNGTGTKPDPVRALAHFTRACEWSNADGCHVAEQLKAADGKPVVLELTSEAEELGHDGLEARSVLCRMDEQGPSALGEVMSSVARYKPALDACAKDGAALKVSWEFADGKVQDAKLHGWAPKKVATCVSAVLRRARLAPTGACEAVLLLGDKDGAMKALAARPVKKKKRDNAVHIKVGADDE
jgi:TPR repeat protein